MSGCQGVCNINQMCDGDTRPVDGGDVKPFSLPDNLGSPFVTVMLKP